MTVFETTGYDHTVSIGKDFARLLKKGDIVRLHGEIGVGKTVFVRGVAKHFGGDADVCSPTFSIMNIYQGDIPVYHFDLYRLESEDEIYEAGLYEFLGGDGISLVEWPELLSSYPGKNIYDVTISKNLTKGENYREIKIEGEGF
ncbi:MAG: tRNA (adenosine(37)-N6)-threonylcarbamoyltransferase complex ATPase subunit type 1 TsaE [Clostridia bacterium]|nr:tRNA (adenosine(37)-N6)-threonylcarbamoyltransferase complex ATPase subunit type 1 TsaE [Clostridia bacterium]